MASPKYKGFVRKKPKPEQTVSSLRKENAYLKRTLVELSRLLSQHNKLLERFLSLETVRRESSQQLTAKDEKIALPSEQPNKKKGGNLMDVVSMWRKRSISSYSREIEEIKNKLVSVSARCQYLENKVARKKDSASNEWASTNTAEELQNHLRDALEKNKQWLEYDQQREAYVRAALARMSWLETQLNEANQARSQQHNEGHSDARELMSRLQEIYERILIVHREVVDSAHRDLLMAEHWCKESESEVEEPEQQLQPENMSRESSPEEDDHWSEGEEQWLTAETENLQCRLDEERRRSANFQLQSTLFQRSLVNCHHADQERIADLERQLRISSQDLEDKKQDCSYLKKQMVRVLRRQRKPEDQVTQQREQQDGPSCEAAHPPSLSSRDGLTPSSHSSVQNESCLECPGCGAVYPASHYRDLMVHLEICVS